MKLAKAIDRLLLPLAPRMALRRIAARMRYEALATYDAAKIRRTERDWARTNKSADAAIIDDADTLRARARMAGRDTWAASSIKDAFVRKVIGTGITPRAAVVRPGTEVLLEKFNAAIDELWYEWARTPRWCDQERTKTIMMKQRLWVSELVEAGEVLILLNQRTDDEQVPLVLQEIEPEQLDTMISDYQGREIRAGIELDAYGGPLAYWVHAREHPLDYYARYGGSVRVPAEQVLHLFDPRRVRQSHGVTRLAAVLRKLRHTTMYDEYELMGARTQAAFVAFITQEVVDQSTVTGGSPLSTGLAPGQTGQDARGSTEVNIEAVTMPHLLPGESVTFPHKEAPNTNSGPYTNEQNKQIAAGTGLDGASVRRDFSEGNFSTQRMNRMETFEETDPLQQLVIDVALRPIWDEFVRLAINHGKVVTPWRIGPPSARRASIRVNWHGPAKLPIDEAKYAAATKILSAMGMTTLQAEANKQGLSWRELLTQKAAERDFADELKLKIPGLNAPAKTAPQEPRPEREPPDESEPEKESGGRGGDELSDRLVDTIIEHATASED